MNASVFFLIALAVYWIVSGIAQIVTKCPVATDRFQLHTEKSVQRYAKLMGIVKLIGGCALVAVNVVGLCMPQLTVYTMFAQLICIAALAVSVLFIRAQALNQG